GGSISQTTGSTISVTNLAAQGAGGVNLNQTNNVSTLAGTTTNSTFTFDAAGTLTVGTGDGVTGVNPGPGDVNPTLGGPGTTTGILLSATPNSGSPVVTGGTVTLTALGPGNGATGQIGSFTATAQFFEVSAATLNADTQNSRLWISAIGGTTVGSVN